MEITIKTTEGKEHNVELIRSVYYTISGKRVKFHIHSSVKMLGCYTITHAKSGMKVRDYPKYGHSYYGMDFAGVAKKMLEEVIDKAGEEKVKTVLAQHGEVFE